MDADRFARVAVQNRQELWDWLGLHHAQSESVWLVTWKAQHPAFYVSREDVLDALIAHGWIDGRRMKLDDDRTMQLISPRRQQVWAQSYKSRAMRLEVEGRMHPAGRDAMERGQASGLWHVSDPVDALVDPDDLRMALARDGGLDWWNKTAPS